MTRFLVLLLFALPVMAGCTKPQAPAKKPATIEATFRPENPHFQPPADAPPAESALETQNRLFWSGQFRAEGGLRPPDLHAALPFIELAYGLSPEQAEAQLGPAFAPVDYTSIPQEDFRKRLVEIRNYNGPTELTPSDMPVSPPGAGGQVQASPRLVLYFIAGQLQGMDLNLSDAVVPDQELIQRLQETYGPWFHVRSQQAVEGSGIWLKTLAQFWQFGRGETAESAVELVVHYAGPKAGDPAAFFDESDRLYGRILRSMAPPLYRIHLRMQQDQQRAAGG